MLEGIFVFQPSPWEDRNWGSLSGLPLEEVWLPVDESVTVFGWFVDAGPTKPVLLWCHGNAGNISHRLENIRELYRRGLSVFIFDYRGYGRSTGSPSEPGMYQDALACYDYVLYQRKIASDRIVLFGRSLGACVAGEVAIHRPSAGVILEGAFPSIQSMSDQHYLGLPARWFVDVEFNLVQICYTFRFLIWFKKLASFIYPSWLFMVKRILSCRLNWGGRCSTRLMSPNNGMGFPALIIMMCRLSGEIRTSKKS